MFECRIKKKAQLAVIWSAQLVHGINENGCMLRFHMLVDAVAEVEYMPTALAVAGENGGHFGTDALG